MKMQDSVGEAPSTEFFSACLNAVWQYEGSLHHTDLAIRFLRLNLLQFCAKRSCRGLGKPLRMSRGREVHDDRPVCPNRCCCILTACRLCLFLPLLLCLSPPPQPANAIMRIERRTRIARFINIPPNYISPDFRLRFRHRFAQQTPPGINPSKRNNFIIANMRGRFMHSHRHAEQEQ